MHEMCIQGTRRFVKDGSRLAYRDYRIEASEAIHMIAAIDPGLNEAGWALLCLCRHKSHKPMPIILATGVVKDKSASREVRVMRTAYKSARAIADQYRGMQHCGDFMKTGDRNKVEPITRVVVEWPQLRSDAVSYAAAAKGDLQMLTMMAGACIAYLHEMLEINCRCNLLTPSEWKGQLSKANTQKRLERFFGSPLRCNRKYGGSKVITHAVDAVGVGLHAMGFPMDCALWRRR